MLIFLFLAALHILASSALQTHTFLTTEDFLDFFREHIRDASPYLDVAHSPTKGFYTVARKVPINPGD